MNEAPPPSSAASGHDRCFAAVLACRGVACHGPGKLSCWGHERPRGSQLCLACCCLRDQGSQQSRARGRSPRGRPCRMAMRKPRQHRRWRRRRAGAEAFDAAARSALSRARADVLTLRRFRCASHRLYCAVALASHRASALHDGSGRCRANSTQSLAASAPPGPSHPPPSIRSRASEAFSTFFLRPSARPSGDARPCLAPAQRRALPLAALLLALHPGAI